MKACSMPLSPHDLTIPNAVTIYLFQGQLVYNFPIIFSLYTFASEIISSTSFDLLQFSMFWVKVFKNRLSKIFYRLSFTNFTWYILEYLDQFYPISNCFKVHQKFQSTPTVIIDGVHSFHATEKNWEERNTCQTLLQFDRLTLRKVFLNTGFF